MSEEKMTILKMLEDGKINAAEAVTLLNQVSENEKPQRGAYAEHKNDPQYANNKEYESDADFEQDRQYRPQREGGLDWVDSLTGTIVESAKAITNFVGSQLDLSRDFTKASERFSVHAGNPEQMIRSLRLAGKNDSIRIYGHDDNYMEIEASYRTKFGNDPRLSLEEDNGDVSVIYDTNAVLAMGFVVKVPKNKIENLLIETKNSAITVNDLRFDTGSFITKNSAIKLEDITANTITAETKNSSVQLEDVNATAISAKTTNSPISLKDVNADTAVLQTTNGSIHTNDSDIVQINAKTCNSPIKFSNVPDITQSQRSFYNWEAITTNGTIKIEVPSGGRIPCKLMASTSMGQVRADVPGLNFSVYEKNYVNAKSPEYDEAVKKLNINLQTSNGSINIRA